MYIYINIHICVCFFLPKKTCCNFPCGSLDQYDSVFSNHLQIKSFQFLRLHHTAQVQSRCCLWSLWDGNHLSKWCSASYWSWVAKVRRRLPLLQSCCQSLSWSGPLTGARSMAYETQMPLSRACHLRLWEKKLKVHVKLFRWGYDPSCAAYGFSS